MIQLCSLLLGKYFIYTPTHSLMGGSSELFYPSISPWTSSPSLPSPPFIVPLSSRSSSLHWIYLTFLPKVLRLFNLVISAFVIFFIIFHYNDFVTFFIINVLFYLPVWNEIESLKNPQAKLGSVIHGLLMVFHHLYHSIGGNDETMQELAERLTEDLVKRTRLSLIQCFQSFLKCMI